MSLMMGFQQTASYAYTCTCTPQYRMQGVARGMSAQCGESQLLWPAARPQDTRADGRHGRS